MGCCSGERKGVRYDAQGEVASCVFCEIIAGAAPARELHVSGRVCWFRSRAGDAAAHWLVCPVAHLKDINDPALSRGLLEEMICAAGRLGARQCFHVPPSNSIDHLHLHAFDGRFRSCLAKLKHQPRAWKCWTITPETVLAKI